VDRATVHRTLKRQERPSRKIISALALRTVYASKTDKLTTNGLAKTDGSRRPRVKPPTPQSNVPRARKGFDFAIVRAAPTPEESRSRLLRFVNGRSVPVPRAQAALLICLCDELGRVGPYERLCLAIGHRSTQKTQHILRQYMLSIGRLLAASKLHYALAVAHGAGYALCEAPHR
jgi:hypothetical protein